MLKLARELDMVTVGLAFDEEDSLRLVEEAQPDIFCFHAGTTKGGLRGYDSGETIEQTAERTEAANRKLRALKKDIILVAHGAAMETPRGRAVHARPHHAATASGPARPPSACRSSAPSRERRGRSPRCASRQPVGAHAARSIAVLATLDTKGQEAEFLREQLKALGSRALVVDMGVLGEPGSARRRHARGGRPRRRHAARRALARTPRARRRSR